MMTLVLKLLCLGIWLCIMFFLLMAPARIYSRLHFAKSLRSVGIPRVRNRTVKAPETSLKRGRNQ